MHNPRLLIIGVLIAAALVWLYVAMPAAPVPRPAAVVPVAGTVAPATVAGPDVEALPRHAPVAPKPADVDAAPAAPAPVAEEEAESEDAPATTLPPADPDRAADLFADQIAREEAEPEKDHLPNPVRDLWKKFDAEKADADWAAQTQQHLQQSLEEWIDGMPEGDSDHVVLVHVECRATLCQVLAADNDIGGQGDRAEAGAEWQQAIASLHGQAWWAGAGFADMTTQVAANEGYILYTTYLLRASAPPPAQPGMAPVPE